MILRVVIIFALTAPVCLAQDLSVQEIRQRMDAGWYEEANALLTPLADAPDAEPTILYLKAKSLLYMGEFKEAESWAEKSVKAAPDSATFWTMLGTTKALQVRKSPLKGITKGRSCKQNMEKGFQLDPHNTEAVSAWLTFNLVAPGFVGGNKDKARELAEDLYAVDPAKGHLARAQVYRHTDDDLSRAKAEMDAAVRMCCDDPKICYDLAKTLMREGFPEAALEYFRMGMERDSDTASGAVQLGGAYLRQEMVTEAQDLFDSALKTNPENSAVAAGKGQVLMAQGRYDAAVALFSEIVRTDEHYLPARYYLAKSYIASGIRHREAARLLNEYLDGYLNYSWPSRAKAQWQLALALEKQGEYDEAYDLISMAMEMPRGSEKMKRDAKRLEFMAND